MADALLYFGPYRVIRTLARGGMAEIFLAKKEGPAGFSKSVVVKRILPEHSTNEEFVQMFRDEARLAAQLEHPNIVHITDFGEVQGSYYLAMEYLQGQDLGSLLRARQKKGQGPFPPAVTASIGSLACAGLHYAHTSAGEDGRPLRIVHRDISPNNLFLTFQGAVKVLDFGIAKAEGKLVQTRAGMVKGKLLYMPPEQTWGKLLDARSDVWALGVVLYELLTGKRPFFRAGEADARELNERLTMEAIDRETPPPPSSLVPGIPAALDAIVLKCVEKSPGARWQSAAELQEALEGFAASQGGVTPSALAHLIETTVGADQVRAATQQTPIARAVAADDPQASVGTQLRPEADRTTLKPAEDLQAALATALQPQAARGPDHEAVPEERTRLKAPAARAHPPRRHRGAGGAVALVVLIVAGAAAAWQVTRDKPAQPPVPPTDGLPGRVAEVDAGPLAPPLAEENPAPPVIEVAEVDAGRPEVALAAEPVVEEGSASIAVRPKERRVRTQPVAKPRKTGRLKVSCSPFGTVFVGEKEMGRASPELNLELPEGTHRVRCVHPSFGESTSSVTITADQVAEKKLRY